MLVSWEKLLALQALSFLNVLNTFTYNLCLLLLSTNIELCESCALRLNTCTVEGRKKKGYAGLQDDGNENLQGC